MTFETVVTTRVFVVICSALLGALLAVGSKKISHAGLCAMISFAAGGLLATALLHILPESIAVAGLAHAFVAALSGYVFFALVNRFVSHLCPACSASHAEINFKNIKWPIISALSIHSFMDGLAIYGASFCALGGHYHGASAAVLCALALHKFPEGLALTLIVRGAGVGRMQALLFTVILEAVTTLAGGLVGFLWASSISSVWIAYIMAHVAGGFIFIVFHALLSELFKHHPARTLISALSGAAVVGLIGYLAG